MKNDPNSKLNLYYNNIEISCRVSSKYLRVTLYNQHNFKSYIKNVITKLSRSVEILSNLRYIFPPLLYN